MEDKNRPQDEARELNQEELDKVDGGATDVSEYPCDEAEDPSGNDMTGRTWKKVRP